MSNNLIRCLTGECKDCSRDKTSFICNYGIRAREVPAGQDCDRRKTQPDAKGSSIIYIRTGPGEEAFARMVTPEQLRDYELIPGQTNFYQPRAIPFSLLSTMSQDSTQIAYAETFGSPAQQLAQGSPSCTPKPESSRLADQEHNRNMRNSHDDGRLSPTNFY